jgi:hypothetical protein
MPNRVLANLLGIFLIERTGTMENRASMGVFLDDMAIPFEYWETVIRKSYSQPEKELMLAVLKDAIMNYKKRMHLGNALFKEAESWLFERERDRLFSFETVCAVLGLRPGKIRGELIAWKLNAMSKSERRKTPITMRSWA